MGPWQRCYGPVATHEAAHRIGQVPDGFGKNLCTKQLHTLLIRPVLLPVFHLHEGHEKRHPPTPEREQKGGDEEGNGRGEHVSQSGRWDS